MGLNARSIAPRVRLAAAAAWAGAVTSRAQATLSDAEAIEQARAAFGRGWTYPWYDAEQDSLRRVSLGWDWSWNTNARFQFPGGEWVLWTLVIVFLLTLAVLIWRITRRLARDGAAPAPAIARPGVGEESDCSRVESLPVPLAVGDADFLTRARDYYQEGNYGTAIIYLFSYQLLELDRHACIRLARGKTNRQYLRELASNRPLGDLLAQTVAAFEEVYFGNRRLTRGAFEAIWSRLDEFHQRLAEPAR